MFMALVDLQARSEVNVVQAGIHILFGGGNNGFTLFSFDAATNATVATPTGVIYRKLVRTLVGSSILGAVVDVSTFPPLPGGTPIPTPNICQASEPLACLWNRIAFARPCCDVCDAICVALSCFSSLCIRRHHVKWDTNVHTH